MKRIGILLLMLVPWVSYASTGEDLYDKHCSKCHGKGGEIAVGSFPDLKGTNRSAAEIKAIVKSGLSTGAPTPMPSIRGLKDGEIDAVIAYIDRLRAVSFNRDVYPIFEKNCLSCHSAGGEGFEASGFSVESYDGILKGTKYGPVVMPGSSVGSTLMMLVEHKTDPAIHMPLRKRKLPEKKIDVIRKWIDQGAQNN